MLCCLGGLQLEGLEVLGSQSFGSVGALISRVVFL